MKNQSVDLAILSILKKHSDADHRLTNEKIRDYLKEEYGLSCDRKTLSRHLQQITNFNPDMISTASNDAKKGCYMEAKPFEVSEVEIMINAIAKANFINEKQTQKLNNLLLSLVSENQSKSLEQVMIKNLNKSKDNTIYNAESLRKAINEGYAISFVYQSIDYKDIKVYADDKKLRHMIPYGLVWNNDRYYCVGLLKSDDPRYRKPLPNSEPGLNMRSFRVEKIKELKISRQHTDKPKLDLNENLESALGMFTGPKKLVTLQLNQDGLALALDEFGRNPNYVHVKTVNNQEYPYLFSFEIQTSPVLFSSFTKLENKGFVVGSAEVKAEYLQYLQTCLQLNKPKP